MLLAFLELLLLCWWWCWSLLLALKQVLEGVAAPGARAARE
jgi:hypothetical protein